MKKNRIAAAGVIVALCIMGVLLVTQEKTPEIKAKKRTSVEVPILMYHYIRTVENPKDIVGKDLSVSAEMFEKQMQYLTDNHFESITFDDLEMAWQSKKELPKNPIILTFDDGYRDFYTTAWPILKKHHIKATEYIVVNFMKKDQYMNEDEIKALDQDPSKLITIGCHTMSHHDVRILSEEKLSYEIGTCKEELEKLLDHEVTTFAYPSGKISKKALAEVQKNGFHTAVTTEEGQKHEEKNRFILTRMRIRGENSIEQFEKLLKKETATYSIPKS